MAIILVPNLTLIPQDKTNACWYFCSRMMSKWAAANGKTKILDPSTSSLNEGRMKLQDLYTGDHGLARSTSKELGDKLGGLKSLTREKRGFEEFKKLIANGPIWAAGAIGGATGAFHVVVIGGVADTGLLFFDPLPMNVGQRVWRTWDYVDKFLALSDSSFDTNLLVPK